MGRSDHANHDSRANPLVEFQNNPSALHKTGNRMGSLKVRIGLSVLVLMALFAGRSFETAFPAAHASLSSLTPPAPEDRVFTEDFLWQGNHASMIRGGLASTVWWDENKWDVRSDTAFNSQGGGPEDKSDGGEHVDIHPANSSDPADGLDTNPEPGFPIGGDGRPGVARMHLDFEGMTTARIRNPMLISANKPGVVEFRTSNFVTSGHWWEVAIIPTEVVAGGEITSVPAPGTGVEGFAGHPGPGSRPTTDSLNFVTLGSEVPCDTGWTVKTGVTRHINGQQFQHVTPQDIRLQTDPSEIFELASWRFEYFPDRLKVYRDIDKDGDLDLYETIFVDIPWNEVYVELIGVGYQANHHPQCLFQGKKREIAWKEVKAWPVKYSHTAAFPKNENITIQTPIIDGWSSYDLRDTQRIGPKTANPPQPNEDRYPTHSFGAFCNGSWWPCEQEPGGSKTLTLNLPEGSDTGITRAQLIYDIRREGYGELEINGVQLGRMKDKSIQPGLSQDTEWAETSVDIPTDLLQAGANTVTINMTGDVAFDRLHFELAYAGFDDSTPPGDVTGLHAATVTTNSIDLAWDAAQDPESGIFNYRVYRDGSLIDTTTVTSYRDAGLGEGTQHSYGVRAVNGAFMDGAISDSFVVSTLADIIAPTIDEISSVGDSGTVSVVFDETVSSVTAENTGNYSINNGIIVSGASLGADGKTVTLSTTPHTEGINYTLTVNGVEDVAAAANQIAANTQVTYDFLLEIIVTIQNPVSYEVIANGLDNGALIYGDRSFVFSGLPAELIGLTYIKTNNADKNATSENHLVFSVNSSSTVMVAYDQRPNSIPDWLDSWTNTGIDVFVENNGHRIYSKDFAPGQITLGGNMAQGGDTNAADAGALSNYVMILSVEGSVVDPEPSTPPSLSISSPTSGQVIVGDSVTVNYAASGDPTGVDHAHLQLDGEAEVIDMDFDGTHTFTGVAPGAHTVQAFLVDASHNKIAGTDAQVSFDTEAVPVAPKVLVFHEVPDGGFVHSSIPAGVAAIHQLGAVNGFLVDDSDVSSVFNDANLAQYDAVVFLSTHKDVLTDSEQQAFERYIQAGGGFVGIHIASGTEYGWAWYGDLVGARFNFHPPLQTAVVIIEDATHPSTVGLPSQWLVFDEWYNFSPRPDRNVVHVLATVDESTYTGGDAGADHPIAWCQVFDGGRSWYTAMGHNVEQYSDPDYLSHILGGIEYSAGMIAADCSPTPTVPEPEPSFFSNISVANGSVYTPVESGIGVGSNKVYTDRDFTFNSVPAEYQGAPYIMTANDDKIRTDEAFLSFNISTDSAIVVGYDTRSTSLPDWMSTWTDTDTVIGTTDASYGMYTKNYAAGNVTLGANMATGASGASSNYIVVAVSADGPVEPPVFPTVTGQSGPARDLDGDGLAEDINANNRLDFDDIVGLFEFVGMPSAQDSAWAFDFNGNGIFDMNDIVRLFEMLILEGSL